MKGDHTVRQAMAGEFSPLDDVARASDSAEDFAIAHNGAQRMWGILKDWKCVTVDGTDYLWKPSDDGWAYDGWERCIAAEAKEME